MALTAGKYVIPDGAPGGGNQATQSATYGDSEVGDLVSGISTNATGLTASVTQTQAGGLALTEVVSNVTSVANDNDAVTLDDAVAGVLQVVYNNGANILQVFPKLGDDLGEGLNLSTTIDPDQFGVFRGIDATNILSVISSPSNGISIHSISATLTRAQMSNGHTNYVTAAITLTCLDSDADTVFNTKSIGSVQYSVKASATDKFYLEGTALDDADKVTSPATGGVAQFQRYDSTGMHAGTESFTDGGA